MTIRLSSVSLLVLLSITGGLLLFLDQSILIVVNYSSLLAIHHQQQHPILPTEIVTNTTIVTAIAAAAAAAVATPITITNSASIAATSSSSTSLSSSKSSSSSSSSSTEGRDKECYMTLDRTRKAVRYDPEQNAIPTLTFLNDDNSNNNNDSSSNSNNNNTMTMMTMEGLSNDYLRKIIRGKKVAIIGDSTLRNLVRWLVRLYDEQAKDLFWMNNNNNNKMKKKNKSIIDSITGLGGLDDGNNNTNSTSSLYRANKDILRIGFQPPCPMCDKDDNGQKICACDPMKLENGFLHYYEEEEDYLDDDNESTIETDIRYFDVRKSKVKTFIKFQPNIVVFNSGLWLLHLYDIRKLGGTKNEEIDAILNWIQYEDIVLRPVIENAIQSKSIKVLLFKTTNHVCDDKYYGQYKDHIELYNNNIININNNNSNSNSKNNNSKATNLLMECKNYFLKLLLRKQETNTNLPESWSQPRDDGSSLLEDYVDNYCMNGTLSDHGSNYLNNRLVKFVNDYNANNTNNDTNNNNSMVVQIFNDHDMQDCSYTTVGDGRHFQGMNLLRIRLLLNQLDCILS